MSFDTASSLSAPQAALQLDADSLLRFLRTRLPDVLVPGQSSPLQVLQFSHGQSNPTYLIKSPQLTKPLVLRKKPPGKILPSAHSVEREFQVLRALALNSAVPVPRPLALCEDSAVLGTPFYIMEFAEGRVFLDCNMPETTPSTRQSVYRQLITALAALHATDVQAAGLQGYGTASHYCRRQLKRWSSQYESSVTATPPKVTQLITWLQNNIPADDSSPDRPVICHGDYRLDNLVFQEYSNGLTPSSSSTSSSPQLAAVLDWELSTLGNRWADVAYACLPYHLPRNMQVLKCLDMQADGCPPQGIPTEQEFVSMYCASAGVSAPSPADWAFYLALSLFRLLAILAGVQARAKQGNASSRVAAAVSSDAVLDSLAGAALSVIQRVAASAPATPAAPAAPAAPATPAAPTNAVSDVTAPLSPRVAGLLSRLNQFMAEHVYPAEEVLEAHATGPNRWTIHPLVEQLKQEAKAAGLWNLWLPGSLAARLQHLLPLASTDLNRQALLGAQVTHWEYAHLCEVMGRSAWAPELFNCGAPDTGNMEVLAKYGTEQQQARWLLPLLQGDIRSCFAMTEKAVASSDATNIQASIRREGGEYVLSGLKWWTSGACDPRCKVAIFMGKTDTTAAKHVQQSMVLVPFDAPGVKVVRPMLVFGYDDAPHGHAEVSFEAVRVPASNLILGEGRGFEIAQGRLGPGRLHHCMRLIGLAERSLQLMAQRALQRTAFGKPLASQGALRAELARCRVEIEGARLLVLHASATIDRVGNKAAQGAVAVAKYVAPNMAQRVVDAAIQVHGGAGVSQDTVLARLWTAARTLRIADGPDEVHLGTIAKLELARAAKL